MRTVASELEEDEEQEGDDVEQFKNEDYEGCECGEENPECDCKFENGDDMDEEDESERSYDGSDAGYYYELKEEREERKQEKLREQKEKERQRDIERTKEEEVRVAYRSLNKAERKGQTILSDYLLVRVSGCSAAITLTISTPIST